MVYSLENEITNIMHLSMVENPFPLPLDDIIQYLFSLKNTKGGSKYMTEELNRKIEKFMKANKAVADIDYCKERGYNYYGEPEAHHNLVQARAEVESEVYRLIGNNAVNNTMDLKKLLESLKR